MRAFGDADRDQAPAGGPEPGRAGAAPAGQRSEATGLLSPEPDSGRDPGREARRAAGTPRAARLTRAAEFAFLAFAASVPVSLAAGQVMLALAALLWLLVLARQGAAGRYPRGLLIGLLLLFAGEWLACLVNAVPAHLDDPLRKHGALLALPVFAVVARRDPLLYRRAIAVALAIAALVGVYAAWQHWSGLDLLRDRVLEPRGDVFVATGCFSHHLSYGGSAMLAFLAAAALALGGERWRGLPLALLPPLGFGLLWCYARSSWMGAFAGLLALVVARRGRRPLALVAIGAAAFLGLMLADPSVRARVREGLAMPEPPPRLLLLATSFRMLADHPLGIAPGRFSELFPIYRVPGRYLSTAHSHSDPMRAALDGGPLGLAGYVVLVAGTFVFAARGLRRPGGRTGRAVDAGEPLPALPAAARRDLLLIALAASAAFLVAGLFQTYFWDQEVVGLWVLLAAPAMSLGGGAASPVPTAPVPEPTAPAPEATAPVPEPTEPARNG